VWAAIWLGKRRQPQMSKLVIIEHNFDAKSMAIGYKLHGGT
jgi:hypothetical protein